MDYESNFPIRAYRKSSTYSNVDTPTYSFKIKVMYFFKKEGGGGLSVDFHEGRRRHYFISHRGKKPALIADNEAKGKAIKMK